VNAVLIIFALIFVGVGANAYHAGFRKCPDCRRHQLKHIDVCVYYDPHPGRVLYRCAKCRAEFVRSHWRWIAKIDWADEYDRELFNIR
jgi:hypothetical protein